MLAQTTMRDLRQALERINQARDGLRQDLARLDEQAEVLQRMLSLFTSSNVEIDTDETRVPEAPAKLVRNAAVGVLREYGPTHYRRILTLLDERGITVNGKDPARNLNAHLSNDDRFTAVGEGIWRLTNERARPVPLPQRARLEANGTDGGNASASARWLPEAPVVVAQNDDFDSDLDDVPF